MSIEVGIWRINGAPQKVTFSALESEARLEGNQNTVTKLRNRFTLVRLTEYFGLNKE